MKAILATISLMAMFVGAVMLLIIIGAVWTDMLTITEGAERGIIWGLIVLASIGSIFLIEREDDPYGKL